MEEELETAELKEKIDEHVEHHAGHGAHESPKWTRYLSVSTALVAVLAAVASLLSGSNSNEAILEKSDAMLNQSLASDQWAYYQAKSVKSAIAAGQAQIIADTKPDVAAKIMADAKRYTAEGEKIKADATELEARVKENNEHSQALMERHHKFAITVTLLQIAIALSAIAALTRRKPMWYVGLGVSAAGLVMFILGVTS
ncbi:MAG: putative transrane protein [Myxococcales bacterium]|nr:putative transrane protein [Myxococcales bacterium]